MKKNSSDISKKNIDDLKSICGKGLWVEDIDLKKQYLALARHYGKSHHAPLYQHYHGKATELFKCVEITTQNQLAKKIKKKVSLIIYCPIGKYQHWIDII